MAASFIVCGPFPHGPVPKYGLEVADVRIAPRRVQLRLGMPVQLRRTADTRRVSRRVHVGHRQGRLRGRETRRLGVALPGIWPGAVHLGHGTQLVLIDGRETPAQRKALETLGKGEAGGPFAVFASVTERWLTTLEVPFDVRLNGIRSTIQVHAGK